MFSHFFKLAYKSTIHAFLHIRQRKKIFAAFWGRNLVVEEYSFVDFLRDTEDIEIQGRRPKTYNPQPVYHANASACSS
jgi:hypothetical protein